MIQRPPFLSLAPCISRPQEHSKPIDQVKNAACSIGVSHAGQLGGQKTDSFPTVHARAAYPRIRAPGFVVVSLPCWHMRRLLLVLLLQWLLLDVNHPTGVPVSGFFEHRRASRPPYHSLAQSLSHTRRQLSEVADRQVICDWIVVAPDSWQSDLNWDDLGYCPANANLRTTVPAYSGIATDPTTSQVTWLSLGSRGLSGSLPAGWSSLEHLTGLSLSSNVVSGRLPAIWGRLQSLKSLWLKTTMRCPVYFPLSGAILRV